MVFNLKMPAAPRFVHKARPLVFGMCCVPPLQAGACGENDWDTFHGIIVRLPSWSLKDPLPRSVARCLSLAGGQGGQYRLDVLAYRRHSDKTVYRLDKGS